MQNKEIEKLLSCDNCPTSYACEGCEITWADRDKIKKYIYELEAEILTHKRDAESWKTAFDTAGILLEFYQEDIKKLENKVKELGKGQHTLMQSRKKWKNRYYKEKRKNDK